MTPEILTQMLALSATAVIIVTQLLKAVPIPLTQKYPAVVNAILSVVASVIVNLNYLTTCGDWTCVLGFAFFTMLIAGATYNTIVKPMIKE